MAHINWTDDQLREAGIKKRKLVCLLCKLDECCALMKDLNLSIYGACGSGHLIHTSRPEHVSDGRGGGLVADMDAHVAYAGMGFDGGIGRRPSVAERKFS